MDKEELRLNTLHRFAKQSERLVLEEHSHCEVPAGCGGVVLRWRNPDLGLPLIITVGTPGTVTMFVDGAEQPTAQVMLPYGEHVLAMHIQLHKQAKPRALLIAAEAATGIRRLPDFASREVRALHSADDGTWLITAKQPASDAWTSATFDDHDWQAMRSVSLPKKLPDELRWRFEMLANRGATPLALPKRKETFWLRKRFILDRPENQPMGVMERPSFERE